MTVFQTGFSITTGGVFEKLERIRILRKPLCPKMGKLLYGFATAKTEQR